MIPELIYKPFYNENHKILGFQHSQAGIKPELIQKSFRERLFCGDCEGRLNRQFEQPSQQVWAALAGAGDESVLKSRPITTPRGTRAAVLSGFDYPTFKLFLLSILWRAGIATRGEYAEVTLGPHEPRLRQMLLGHDPGERDDYPCLLFITQSAFRGISIPLHSRLEGHHAYRFLLGRVLLWFVVSQHFGREGFMQGALNERGWWLAHFVALDALPEFREAARLVKGVEVPERMLRP